MMFLTFRPQITGPTLRFPMSAQWHRKRTSARTRTSLRLMKPYSGLPTATGVASTIPRLFNSIYLGLRQPFKRCVWISVSRTAPLRTLLRLTAIILDLDNNTFEGFKQIQQAIAQDDPYQIQYTQDLTLIVRILLPSNIINTRWGWLLLGALWWLDQNRRILDAFACQQLHDARHCWLWSEVRLLSRILLFLSLKHPPQYAYGIFHLRVWTSP